MYSNITLIEAWYVLHPAIRFRFMRQAVGKCKCPMSGKGGGELGFFFEKLGGELVICACSVIGMQLFVCADAA
jgi:hypothetical protein